MATDHSAEPSFSRSRKWSVGFNVALSILAVLAVVVMANYLSGRYFRRFQLSANSKVELSPRTLGLVRSITNRVQIILYYDREDSLYSDIFDLLRAYRSANPKISVVSVDYYRSPGAAQEIKLKYDLGSSTNRNFVIFDCEGRTKIVDGTTLAQYTLEQMPNEKEREFRRKPVQFNGEMMFSGALLAVMNPHPAKAYFLQGHSEPLLNDDSEGGYKNFALVLRQNYIDVEPLSLLGTNEVPMDCNLLIIAGPAVPIPDFELQKIDHYLDQGGRLFALFDARSAAREVGLEKILTKWGVQVQSDLAIDPEHMATGKDVVISTFTLHQAVNPVVGSGLYMIVPRPVGRITADSSSSDAPKVEEVAYTGEKSYLYTDKKQTPKRLPVLVTVDSSAKGAKERGLTRMLISGDSFFLANGKIDLLANRGFANAAVNWLLNRNYLLEGVGPRPVTEYRFVITQTGMKTLKWILLGLIPGGILLFGGLVWLRRRK